MNILRAHKINRDLIFNINKCTLIKFLVNNQN